jgi:putative (di)nucleoside polyphosphate hydrolase
MKSYRLGVGIMLIGHNSKVFVGKRADNSTDAWQMPQGGIDEGEDYKDAAIRELKEEIGTDNVEIIAESEGWYSYDIPAEIASRLWQGKYAGQKQKWFLMRFLGKDEEININTEHPEFVDWKWVEPSLLPDIIVDFKQDLYRKLVQEFSAYI